MMPKIVPASLFAALLLVALSAAHASDSSRVHRSDTHRAQWHAFEGRSGCHLVHELPQAGVALISYRHADSRQYLSFFARRPPRQELEGTLYIAPPPWGGGERQRVEPLRVHPSSRTFRFSRRTTQRLLEALRSGREPQIRYTPSYSDRPVTIALTPAAFGPAHRQYLACIDRQERVDAGVATRGAVIPGRTGEPVADADGSTWEGNLPRLPRGPQTEVYFATGSAALTRDALERIREFIRHLEGNPHWGVVLATGYADGRGDSEANQRLARARAQAVRDELIRGGIPEERIEIEGHLPAEDSEEAGSALELAEQRRVELRTAL